MQTDMPVNVQPKQLPIETTIQWASGETTERVVNFNNKLSLDKLIRVAGTALAKGGSVSFKPLKK